MAYVYQIIKIAVSIIFTSGRNLASLPCNKVTLVRNT